jgi:protein-disulfide isomerase
MQINDPSPSTSDTSFSVWQFTGLIVLAFLVGIGVGFLVWGYPLQKQLAEVQQAAEISSATSTASAANAEMAAANQPENSDQGNLTPTPKVIRYNIPIDDDVVLGPETAAITVIEFSDYECPFCKKWHDEVFYKLRDQYGDQIRFVYRDFPLYGLHPNAASAAEAAQCAGAQNKYWEYHERLFSGEKSFGRASYVEFANQLNLDQPSFEKCIDDRTFQKEVEADYQFASELGIQSTPTFFINGLAIVGAQPFEVFERIINMELAGEIPQ